MEKEDLKFRIKSVLEATNLNFVFEIVGYNMEKEKESFDKISKEFGYTDTKDMINKSCVKLVSSIKSSSNKECLKNILNLNGRIISLKEIEELEVK